MEMIEFADDEVVSIKEVTALYSDAGWIRSAADPDLLARAVDRSTYVVTARDQQAALIGLSRCLSDDVSVMYLQEVVVHPDHDSIAVGSILVQRCLSRHEHVRQKFALTDADAETGSFFEALGFRNIDNVGSLNVQTFVQFDGIEDVDAGVGGIDEISP